MTDKTYQLSEMLAPELTIELAKTRKSLERAPDDQGMFKPHPKSTALLNLCNHLTTVSGLGGTILTVDGVDFGSPTDPRRIVKESNVAAILQVFDELAAASIKTVQQTNDAAFRAAWQATRAGQVVFSGTRYAAFRNICVNHMIHHRAQLGVYLRHLDVPVPALFGPSADEQ